MSLGMIFYISLIEIYVKDMSKMTKSSYINIL